MTFAPTPSQQINALLAQASAWASGVSSSDSKDADQSALLSSVEARLAGFPAARQDFESRAEAAGPEFGAAHADLIERVGQAYAEHEELMQALTAAVRTDNPEAVLSVCEELHASVAPLFESLSAYSKAFMEFGDSPYPLINMTRKLAEAVRSGQMPGDAASVHLDEARAFYGNQLEQLRKAGVAESETWSFKTAALGSLIEVLGATRDALAAGTLEEEGVLQLQHALTALDQSDENVFAARFMVGPTAMPAANLVINTAEEVLAGRQPAASLTEALDWYDGYIARLEGDFDRAVTQNTSSMRLLEELPRTREILDLHLGAVAAVRSAAEAGEPDAIEAALHEVRSSVERLNESVRVYMEVGQTEHKISCPHCQHLNFAAQKTCESCGAVLPRFADPELAAQSSFEIGEAGGLGDATEGVVITTNVYRLFEAVYKFYEGEIEEAAYRKAIETSRDHIDKAWREFDALPDKVSENPEEVETLADTQELLDETRELMMTGMEEWSEGLDLMEAFIDEGQRPGLELGIQLVWNASQKLQQVLRVGEMTEKAAAELKKQELAPTTAGREDEVDTGATD